MVATFCCTQLEQTFATFRECNELCISEMKDNIQIIAKAQKLLSAFECFASAICLFARVQITNRRCSLRVVKAML